MATEVNILIFLEPNVLIVKSWDTMPRIVGQRRKETTKENNMYLLLKKKKNQERELEDHLVIRRKGKSII